MTDPLNRALVSARATLSRDQGLKLYARALEAGLGVPLSFDRNEPRLTGVEYLLGAVASDVLGGFLRLAKRRRLPVDDLEAVLKADVGNTLAWLEVVGAAGSPRIEGIAISVYASSSEPEERVRQLWDEALARAPIVNTLRASLPVQINLQLTT